MNRPNDVLTDLPGRPAMEDELAQRLGRQEPFAVALVDVDFFQEINDQHGHSGGTGR